MVYLSLSSDHKSYLNFCGFNVIISSSLTSSLLLWSLWLILDSNESFELLRINESLFIILLLLLRSDLLLLLRVASCTVGLVLSSLLFVSMDELWSHCVDWVERVDVLLIVYILLLCELLLLMYLSMWLWCGEMWDRMSESSRLYSECWCSILWLMFCLLIWFSSNNLLFWYFSMVPVAGR